MSNQPPTGLSALDIESWVLGEAEKLGVDSLLRLAKGIADILTRKASEQTDMQAAVDASDLAMQAALDAKK